MNLQFEAPAATRVNNEDCSPQRIYGRAAASTPTGFAEIVSDDFPVNSRRGVFYLVDPCGPCKDHRGVDLVSNAEYSTAVPLWTLLRQHLNGIIRRAAIRNAWRKKFQKF